MFDFWARVVVPGGRVGIAQALKRGSVLKVPGKLYMLRDGGVMQTIVGPVQFHMFAA